jgi:hypothetical protein
LSRTLLAGAGLLKLFQKLAAVLSGIAALQSELSLQFFRPGALVLQVAPKTCDQRILVRIGQFPQNMVLAGVHDASLPPAM